MSFGIARQKAKIFDFNPRSQMALIASASSWDPAGVPASILWTPTSSSFFAMATLSSFVKMIPGCCSPSRSVVSSISIFGAKENVFVTSAS